MIFWIRGICLSYTTFPDGRVWVPSSLALWLKEQPKSKSHEATRVYGRILHSSKRIHCTPERLQLPGNTRLNSEISKVYAWIIWDNEIVSSIQYMPNRWCQMQDHTAWYRGSCISTPGDFSQINCHSCTLANLSTHPACERTVLWESRKDMRTGFILGVFRLWG